PRRDRGALGEPAGRSPRPARSPVKPAPSRHPCPSPAICSRPTRPPCASNIQKWWVSPPRTHHFWMFEGGRGGPATTLGGRGAAVRGGPAAVGPRAAC